MSIGVCFSAEKKVTYQDQWSYLFSNFGVTEIWERDYEGGDLNIYQDTTPIESARDLPSARPLVVMAPPDGRFYKGEESLFEFKHPDAAIYLFGGSHRVLTEEDMGGRKPDHLVYIPTEKHEMYAFAAAYITLYDLRAKKWQTK